MPVAGAVFEIVVAQGGRASPTPRLTISENALQIKLFRMTE